MKEIPSTHFCGHRFIVLSRLGDGGAASVWRVVDSKYDIERAVKTLHLTDHENTLSRFEQEVKIMMRLQSPNIVTVFESFVEDERLYIVMEKCSGSLDTWSKMHGQMPIKMAVNVLISMLKGLEVAHRKGVVHRDIKPHNVLVADDGTIKVADFGLALLYLSPESLTKTGALLGSLAFMSPEQRLNPSDVTPATDLYSATMTLVWLMEGHSVGDLYLTDTLNTLRSKYPNDLIDIVERGGKHKTEDRYQSAAEMIQALKQIESTLPEFDHSLMGLHLIEVSIHDLTPSVKPSEAITQNESMELKALNSVRWLLVVVVIMLTVLTGIFFWQFKGDAASQLPIGVEDTREISMCKNPIRAFTRMSKLGPKESIQSTFEDLNQDGKLDLLYVNQYSQSLSIYWGNEEYKMLKPLEIDFERSNSKPLVVDLNDDGLMDIVSLHIDLQMIQLHMAQSTTKWAKPSKENQTVLFQFPLPLEGIAYDQNNDGLLDLYLIGRDIDTSMFDAILRLGSEEERFKPHDLLMTFKTQPVFEPNYPRLYWLDSGVFFQKDLLNLSESPRQLMTGLDDWIVHQTLLSPNGGLEVYLYDPDNFIHRWTEESGLCQLSMIPIDSRDIDYKERFGYWDDNDTLDIATTRTCVYCTSNHVLLLGME